MPTAKPSSPRNWQILKGRESEAMRLYEEAIRSAREGGFVQNEAIASELAARFYEARGAATAVQGHLRNARSCYERWGACRQSSATRRALSQSSRRARNRHRGDPTSTLEQLDVAAVIKTSQAVSGEIVLDRLIERLMVIAIEHAGADRGLLILSEDENLRIEAEATISSGVVAGCPPARTRISYGTV